MTQAFDAIIIGAGQAGPSLAGRLTAAGGDAVSIESAGEEIEIPFELISRSNLVPELSEVQS